jgi:hypothetical protein
MSFNLTALTFRLEKFIEEQGEILTKPLVTTNTAKEKEERKVAYNKAVYGEYVAIINTLSSVEEHRDFIRAAQPLLTAAIDKLYEYLK